jgi:hypothetical protein
LSVSRKTSGVGGIILHGAGDLDPC